MSSKIEDQTLASAPQEPAHISRAKYPIPQPLATLLRTAILDQKEAQVETLEHALGQLVGNSFQAMDSMYFST